MPAPTSNAAKPAPTVETQTGQVNTNGSNPQEATQTPTSEDSAKFAALARKEKAIRAREAAVKAQEAKFSEQFEAKLQAERAELEKTYRSKLSKDPWGEMIAAGLSPEQATQILLNQPRPEDLRYESLESKLEAQSKRIESLLNQSKDSEQKQYEQAKSMVTKEVALLVDGNENFETIKAMSAHEAVVQLIEDTLNEDGIMLSAEEAAQQVEDYLVEQTLSFAKLKKIQSKLTPPQVDADDEKQAPLTQKQPQAQTLSRSLAQQASAKRLTAEEKRQRAILAFQGKLQT